MLPYARGAMYALIFCKPLALSLLVWSISACIWPTCVFYFHVPWVLSVCSLRTLRKWMRPSIAEWLTCLLHAVPARCCFVAVLVVVSATAAHTKSAAHHGACSSAHCTSRGLPSNHSLSCSRAPRNLMVCSKINLCSGIVAVRRYNKTPHVLLVWWMNTNRFRYTSLVPT